MSAKVKVQLDGLKRESQLVHDLAEYERIIQIQEIFDLQVLDFSFYNLRLHRISVVEGLDLNAFYSFIDSKTDIDKNTPKFVFQYTTWSALFNGIIRDQ